ncbi:hypothetical protein [Acidovorax sp. Q11]
MSTWEHNSQDFQNLVNLVKGLAESIKFATSQLGQKPIPAELAEHIKTFNKNLQDFIDIDDIASPKNVDHAYMLASRMATYARAIAMSQFYDQYLRGENSSKANLFNHINQVETVVKARPVLLEISESETEKLDGIRLKSTSEKIDEISKKIENLHSALTASQKRSLDLDSSISDLSRRLDEKFIQLERSTETFFSKIQRETDDRAEKIFDNVNKINSNLEFKQAEIDAFIGNLTRKALSGNYMRSAIKEEKIANDFRKAAIAMMIALGIFVIGTLAHMELLNLEPQKSALRAFSAIFFSFVIAYLIRQSAVHRAQHQRHLQTALDLRAIGPYAADMPDTDRNEIKKQIAEKIFVPKEALAAGDNGGFGAQEIISKVIDKLELPKKN